MGIPISRYDGRLAEGDFGASLEKGVLLVPARLMKMLTELGLQSAQAFVGYAEAFPTDVGTKLRWKTPQVRAATRKLVKLLADGAFASRPAETFRHRRLGARRKFTVNSVR
jgi:predicted nucleic acid-binding Zn ribbon protein